MPKRCLGKLFGLLKSTIMNTKKIVRYIYGVIAFSYFFTSHWLLPLLVDNPGEVHQVICIFIIISSIPIAIYTIPKDEYRKVLIRGLFLGLFGLVGYLLAVNNCFRDMKGYFTCNSSIVDAPADDTGEE